MRQVLMVILTILFFSAYGQKQFSETDLIASVQKFHPVAKQALLDIRMAAANVTASRSHFDPVLNLNNSRKEFDGITYYDQQWGELKIPTWYGVDVYTGIEKAEGIRINPEETKGRVNYIGVSVPLLQNLLIDKRRAAVQQAIIWRDQSEVSRRTVLNNLLQEALISYWEWWGQYHSLQIIQSSLENANRRFQMVKTMYRLGERPAIDTIEALTQVQILEQYANEALIKLIKSRFYLSTFLWKENNVPYDLPEDVIPKASPSESQPGLDSLLLLLGLHPSLLEYDFKLESLQIDKRLKFQLFLPEVDVKYQQLDRNFSGAVKGALFQNNYRYGFAVSVPLRLSEARGAYQSAKLKIEQVKLSQSFKRIELQNKVKSHYAEWVQTISLQERQKNLISNYTALQKGEEIRFTNGESSLFLINSREQKTIEAQQKLISLNAQKQQARVNVYWAAGILASIQ
jgi:outer membrane protein TolC